MRIVLLGAPGAGKGTQCKKIVDKYGLTHLSSGDILRKHRAEDTELGRKAQGYMDSGQLVPDELIVKMMIEEIKKAPPEGFVLDGFPRTVNQAEKLDEALQEQGQQIDVVVNLQIDDEIIYNRMTGRRSCPKCGAVYHVENMPPKVDGVCDNDGTALVQRPDDTREVVSKRLKTYHEQTEPVIGYYKGKRTVLDIDANTGAEQVNSVVTEKLESLK